MCVHQVRAWCRTCVNALFCSAKVMAACSRLVCVRRSTAVTLLRTLWHRSKRLCCDVGNAHVSNAFLAHSHAVTALWCSNCAQLIHSGSGFGTSTSDLVRHRLTLLERTPVLCLPLLFRSIWLLCTCPNLRIVCQHTWTGPWSCSQEAETSLRCVIQLVGASTAQSNHHCVRREVHVRI